MPLERISNRVYAQINHELSSPSDSNRGYIICSEHTVVVDTTCFLQNLRRDLEELRKITQREVRYVINTHHHTDHAYGNGLFGCEIIAHRKCLCLMKRERSTQLAELFQEVSDTEDRRLFEKVRYPTILFEESYKLDSTPTIEVLHLGGHTPDLSAVYIPEGKILFASDNLFGSEDPSTPSHPFMTLSSDLNEWRRALQRILQLDVETIIPGHFGVCNKKAVSRLDDYLQDFMTRIRELKMQGVSKEEAMRRPELLDLPRLSLAEWIANNIEAQYDKI